MLLTIIKEPKESKLFNPLNVREWMNNRMGFKVMKLENDCSTCKYLKSMRIFNLSDFEVNMFDFE